jgi:hypothetical protein
VWECFMCGRPATALCSDCAGDVEAFACRVHVATHGCGSDAFLPVANSPRMGVCGYTGEEP